AAPVGCPVAFTGASCDLPRFELLALPQAATKGVAVGLSANGGAVVGNATTATAQAGFRWTHTGGVVLLDALATQTGRSVTANIAVVGMSSDGTVIAGNSSDAAISGFIWNATLTGLTPLGGDDSTNVLALSADGSTVVGDSLQGATKSRRVRWLSSTQPVLLD